MRLLYTVGSLTYPYGMANHYGTANHGIFRDFFLTQRAKFGDNPARFFATLRNFLRS